MKTASREQTDTARRIGERYDAALSDERREAEAARRRAELERKREGMRRRLGGTAPEWR